MHLNQLARREKFRQARDRVQAALGNETMQGYIRPPQSGSHDTHQPAGEKGKPTTFFCWILDQGKQLPLKIGLNSIGRLPDNDVVIDDPTVSRRHCAIVVHSDMRLELFDVASKNGTILNGRKLSGPTLVKDGDEIILCEHKLTVSIESGQATMDRVPLAPKPLTALPSADDPDDHTLAM